MVLQSPVIGLWGPGSELLRLEDPAAGQPETQCTTLHQSHPRPHMTPTHMGVSENSGHLMLGSL